MEDNLFKMLTNSKYIDRSASYEKQILKVSPFLMPLPRSKVRMLYALIYVAIIISLLIVFYFNHTEVAAGVLLFCLAMVLVVRKSFCDQHYLNVLFEDHSLVVNEEYLEVPAILTETRQRMKIAKHKVKQIIVPWNTWYVNSWRSSFYQKKHTVFTIVIALNNQTQIDIPPNSLDHKVLLCKLAKDGYELIAKKVETQPAKDFYNFFFRPVAVIFCCLIVYGIYTLFEL